LFDACDWFIDICALNLINFLAPKLHRNKFTSIVIEGQRIRRRGGFVNR